MLRPFIRLLERCIGRFSGGDGLLWHQDLKPHATCVFSIAVVQANPILEDQSQVISTPFGTFVGVYDGHGGPEASRFVSNRLFPYFDKFVSEEGGVSGDAIKKAFDATEKEFLNRVKMSWLSQPQIASVGSCCLVGVITEDMLYVANLGDSRLVLGRRTTEGDRVDAERLTCDHNVSVEEIRQELAELHPDDSHIVVHNQGVWRIKGIIQVSRSIGDAYLKKPEFSRDLFFNHLVAPTTPLKRPVMSAEPSIYTRQLRTQDLFLIFASDGLWEQLSDESAVNIVFKSPRPGIAKRLVRAAVNEAAKKRDMKYADIRRLEKGVRRRFHDDITVIVVFLDCIGANQRLEGQDYKYINAPIDIFSLKSHKSDQSVS